MKDKPKTQTQPETGSGTSPRATVAQRLWRRVENIAFGIVAATIFLYFVLQSAAVQNWIIGKITGYLSEELQTTVEIQHVDFSFFDNLLLEGLYMEDLHGDTLLYAERLKAGLNSNIFSLLSNELEFNEIGLTKARINIRRLEGENANNLQFLIDYFSSPRPKPERTPAPFHIRVQNLRLTDVKFLQEDNVKGKRLWASVPNGTLRINNLDIPSKIVDVQSVFLEGVAFSIAEFPASPEPAGSKKVSMPSDSSRLSGDTLPLRLTIRRLSLKDGYFSLDRFDASPGKTTPDQVIDYQHMAVANIAVEADSVYADDDLRFTGVLHHLAAAEQSGVAIRHLGARKVVVNDTLAGLYGMRLETNGSVLGDTLALHYSTYRDFHDFTNRVYMEGRFDSTSRVRLGDIMFFSPGVEENPFFINNRNQVVDISGRVDGRVNRLNGRGLDIRVGNSTRIAGSFDGDDMAEGSDRMRLLFDLENARTTMTTLRMIIPGFTAPAYFNRLGNINFRGTYQILFGSNHILNGDLVTDIGYGNLDMKLDLAGGQEKALYSGFLNMFDFDMAAWTGNREFGKTTFQVNIAGGEGLTVRTIKARLTGGIESFYYRGYNYQNVEMNGLFDQSVFVGELNMKDPNIDFTFDGTVNLKDTIPEYDFKVDLRRLDLGALHLVNDDWVLSGRVEKIKLFARDWRDLRGAVVLRNFRLIQDKKMVHQVDSLTFAASNRPDGNRYFILLSDIADGILEGRFEIDRMANSVLRFFHRQYPAIVQQVLGHSVPDTTDLTDNYKINLQIKDTRSLTRLFDPKLDTIRNLNVRAKLDAEKTVSEFRLQMPGFRYDGLQLRDVSFAWMSENSAGTYSLDIPQALLPNGQQLTQLHLGGTAVQQNIEFALTTEDTLSIVERINLKGVLSTVDSFWQIQFNTSEITLFNEAWYMDDNNYLRFSKDYFEARNFDLMHGNQRIEVEELQDGRGARFSLANFNLNFLQRLFLVDKLDYRGKIFNLDIEVQDIFALKSIQGYITTDTIFINDRPYGALIGNLEMDSLDGPLWWKVFVNDKSNHQLRVLGTWVQGHLPAKTVEELGVIRPGEFQTLVTATNFPMEVLELFIPDISKTSGTINTSVQLGGPFDRVVMRGAAKVDGRFQLDYLKAMFYIPNQTIQLNEYQIWADGDTVLDGSRKNAAIIRRGLRHDHFKNWRLDCEIQSIGSSFLVMNTLREDNAMYYGQGIGRFDARFTGSFSKPNIYIDAWTGRETRLYIPLSSSSSDIQDASFITFRDKSRAAGTGNGKTKNFIPDEIKGLNLEMNLSISTDAEVQLIFDEQSGDIIKGRGEGNIRLTINREGEFKMYGTYQISRGEYLFTLLNWVNKPFTVAEGGTITWFGDPYGAQISLDATYAENTSLYNLLRDELAVTNDLSEEASKSTRGIVTMHLKGDLFKPNISFDLSFPNVSSQLKSLVESKLSLLRQDQNELTRQVFGLVVVGSFLPPSGGSVNIQSSDYLASAFNTLTQVLSNQFSNYLTGLASEWFGGAVSSIDFDIAYNEYRNQTDPGQTDLAQIGRELQLRLTSGFANDRITVQVGSQFGLGQPGTTSNNGFLGEDVTVEIQLTENRQWRLKVYQRTEPDVAGGSRRSRYGFGISFRKEYDSFSDLMGGLTGWFTGKKDKK